MSVIHDQEGLMSSMSSRSRSGWAKLAGVLLLLDGLATLIFGLVFMVVFRPVAAIEGRPSPDQTPYWVLVPAALIAIAFFWAGQRAIRGIRGGRIVGVVLAGVVGLLFAWLPFTGSMDASELVTTAALLVPQVLIVIGLLRWPEAAHT
jgi:hypothetical protein